MKKLMTVISLVAIFLSVSSCMDNDKLKYLDIGNRILMLHRPYSVTYGVSTQIKGFIKKKSNILAEDFFTTSTEEYYSNITNTKNIVILSEAYSAYFGQIQNYYTHLPLTTNISSKLYLLENDQKGSTNEVAVFVFDKKLRQATVNFNIEEMFDTDDLPKKLKIISKPSEAKNFEYVIVDERYVKMNLLKKTFDVEAESVTLFQNNWLISNSYYQKLKTAELEKEFVSLLTKDSLSFLTPKSKDRAQSNQTKLKVAKKLESPKSESK